MKAGTDMPAIEGETIGMTRDNCMAYCFDKNKRFKYFGEISFVLQDIVRKALSLFLRACRLARAARLLRRPCVIEVFFFKWLHIVRWHIHCLCFP